MSLYKILAESFELLRDQPRFFVPRLISTSISTVWFIFVLENYVFSFSGANFSPLQIIFYLVSGPLIAFMGVFVSVMLAKMVDSGPQLRKSFRYTIMRFKSLMLVTLGILSASFLVATPFSFGIVLYPVLGLPVLIASGAISLVIFVAISFAIYFLPIALVESSRMVEMVKKSVSASRNNYLEVSIMLAFSLALLILAGLAQGVLETLGYIGFGLSRLISAVISTYIFVVSPKLYLSE